MVDVREMGTVFCWEICGPRMGSSEMREIFMYCYSIIWLCICRETDNEDSENGDLLYLYRVNDVGTHGGEEKCIQNFG
jgi:hypothetical protein